MALRRFPAIRSGRQTFTPAEAEAMNRALEDVERLLRLHCVSPLKLDPSFGNYILSIDQTSSAPVFARIVGEGQPTRAALVSALAPGATTMTIGPLTGAVTELPTPSTTEPLRVQVGNETVLVTAIATSGDNRVCTITRPLNPGSVTVPTYSVATNVEFLRTRPLAFVQVRPNPTASGTGAPWIDDPDGEMGVVNGAKLTADAALLIIASLGADSVSVSGGVYTGATTINPAYQVNGQYINPDGSVIVELTRPDATSDYWLADLPHEAPILVRLLDRLDSAVSTTLASSYTAGASTITVASVNGFPSPSADPATFWYIRIGNTWLRANGGGASSTVWPVVHVAGPDANASVGATVTLIDSSWAWRELTQTQSRSILEAKIGGRYSGADATNSANQPAYPMSLPPILADGSDYDLDEANGPCVWIYPGLAAARSSALGGRYWLFDWPGATFKPPSYTNYQTDGMIDGSAIYTIQWLGVGLKASDGWATGYPTAAGGPLNTALPYSAVEKHSASGVYVGDAWSATATQAPVGSPTTYGYRLLAKENYGWVAIFGLDPTSSSSFDYSGINGADTKAANIVTGSICATQGGVVGGTASSGRLVATSFAVSTAVPGAATTGTWSGLHATYKWFLRKVTPLGKSQDQDTTGASYTVSADTDVVDLTWVNPTAGITNQGGASSYELWRVTSPGGSLYRVKSGLSVALTTYSDTGSYESTTFDTGDNIGGETNDPLEPGIDRVVPPGCVMVFKGGWLVRVGSAGTPAYHNTSVTFTTGSFTGSSSSTSSMAGGNIGGSYIGGQIQP